MQRRRNHWINQSQDWTITYSDVVTSLLAFFVIIVAISTIDQRKLEYVQEGIQVNILKQPYEKPFQALSDKIESIIKKKEFQNDVFVSSDNTGITITFSSAVLYDSGSAKILDAMIPFLTEISHVIQSLKYNRILIEVEGHTDDLPINTPEYPSNWELSTARSAHVIRFFENQGISPRILKASGYANARPLSDIKLVNADDIDAFRSSNRRITVSITRDDGYNIPTKFMQ